MRISCALGLAVTLGLVGVTGALAQAPPPEAQGDFYTEPVGLPLPQEGFNPLTSVYPGKAGEQPVANLPVAGGHWESRVGDAALAVGINCLVSLGMWPSAESKVGQRCVAAGWAAARPYPPEELPLTERWKGQEISLQLVPQNAWNLTGRKWLVFWLRVKNLQPLGHEPRVGLRARGGDKVLYSQGAGTAELLAALTQADTWQEVRVPLAEFKPQDAHLEKFPLEQVLGVGITLDLGTPEVFTEVVWIDGLRFE
jgi:hypothetical protein